MNEGNHENAYILFLRFLTLFVDLVPKHPKCKEIPAQTRKENKQKILEIMNFTEKLKVKLLDRYGKEYEQFLIDQEEQKKRAIEEAKKKEQEPSQPRQSSFQPLPSAPNLEEIVYPGDFPSIDPAKSSPGLLPGTKPPQFDRTIKPSNSFMEGGMRKLTVPDDTMKKFLELAKSNTLKNIETCGILAGKLQNHQLFITHIIIPKQSGTSDSCNTMNEEEIFDVQDNLQLVTLGWIHTHPTQSAFLSSVDLHTQAGYQIMMPEALAIVCSPKHEEMGFFSLTSAGLEFISKCRQEGFHPHPPDQFYEATHFELDKCRTINIVDLRQR